MDFFFFNDTATTEIYTLSLHDALPISAGRRTTVLANRGLLHRFIEAVTDGPVILMGNSMGGMISLLQARSEEHTSELQSRQYLVCRLLLEKKIKITYTVMQNGTNVIF